MPPVASAKVLKDTRQEPILRCPRSTMPAGPSRKQSIFYGSLPLSAVEWLMLGDSTADTPFLPTNPGAGR